MMTIDICNSALERFGYIVIWSQGQHNTGDIIDNLDDGEFGMVPGPMVVVAETNFIEWRTHARACFEPDYPIPESLPLGLRFYRVKAE